MGKRLRQKGIMCSVGGCDNWCVSKGLCHKHGMSLRRYGDVMGGKVNRKGVCKQCGGEFKLIKSNQEYCNKACYQQSSKGKANRYAATKAYRARNKDKILAVGIFRRHPFKDTDSCLVCNTKNKLHRHHHNYKSRKDVTILCKDCHIMLHQWDSN